ncbi:MAG: hypothetical protein QXT63_01225 [Thermoplasmata archaeon]
MHYIRGHRVLSGYELENSARQFIEDILESELPKDEIEEFNIWLGEALIDEYDEKMNKLSELNVRKEELLDELSKIEEAIKNTVRALDKTEEELIDWHNYGIVKYRALTGNSIKHLTYDKPIKK